MLVLSREIRQSILIGDDVIVTILAVNGDGRVRLGIEAPIEVIVDRAEVRGRRNAEGRPGR